MFKLDADKAVRFCDGVRRRDFLHAGSLALLGFGMPDFASLKALGAVNPDKDVNCIMLFLLGAPSQLDTWDMKPDAPAEIRGPFKPIRTNAADIRISEIFPRMAKHADKFSLVRSVYHTAPAVHDTGHQLMQTGRLFQGGIQYPHAGCVVTKYKGPKSDIPPHVLIPRPMGPTGGNMPHGQDAGFLGKNFDPFVLNADPSDADFKVPDLLPPDYIASLRVDRRRSWRNMIDNAVKAFENSQDAKLLDSNFQQAYTLMSSPQAREAFDLPSEPDAVRDKYGRNRFGQGCLLARRLIERGCRFVTVNMFETVFNEITWDIHGSKPFTSIGAMKDYLGPMMDHAYSSLLEDLSDRGMLENTLVVATGEFGRTPKINPAGGRDHWPQCWTMLFAGGGVKGGRVVGASDDIGGYPKDRPTTPAEVVATIFHALGIDLNIVLEGPSGRAIPLVDRGVEPIYELFS